ncbi:LytTR family DNA-binding domain-containing protein [Niabella yanshanensis]|uniref:LytTR family DNA-binding domain-containing protein n=1 Tax=Niabella yanshanensis TaxID=577386 RepID=A0ABZ0W0Q3_9BACT|nr:LytTR family DNA-binding domain-containing protein [Niabella yanshanensis]WQD36646.1 LytTR family DNA-binding domain-containing protein [Niabella yanshanensis]
MIKIKCTILDDEPRAVQLLESYVKQTEDLILLKASTSFADIEMAIKENKSDLIFLDIQMPEENGMDIIKRFNYNNSFILTTAYSDYALEGYEYNVVDFLLKPISYKRFLQAIQKFKAIKSYPRFNQRYIFIRESGISYKLLIENIQYVEGLRDYIKIYTADRTFMVLNSLGAFLKQLPEGEFIRTHRSFIVNMKRVEKVEPTSIVIAQRELPIGDAYKKQFLSIVYGKNKK